MKRAPSRFDRIVDAAAILLVVGGIGLYAFARHALTGIGEGTWAMPQGVSAVAVADFHVAQSWMGLFVVGLGVLVGIAAAVRHGLRVRVPGQSSEQPLTSEP
jgi:stage V sporulation protein SpoVS